MTMIRDIVNREIDSDADWCRSDDKRIIKRYKSASKPAKQDVDDIFISITGYSLVSIIKFWRAENGK